MYRSLELYNKTQIEDFDIFPICVPTYNRPNPPIISSLEQFPELPIILFIRNTDEQKNLYKHLKKKCRIVCLNDVHDLGETRRAIVNWCIKNKISNIFMFDDDIKGVDFLYPYETCNGTLCMRAHHINVGTKSVIDPTVLRMWIKYIRSSRKDLTISAPLYRPDSWHMKNADAEFKYNSGACIQCIHLNIKNLYKNKINYIANAEGGVEDYYLQFQVMSAGLTTSVFTDLMYECPAVGALSGGCENANGIKDLNERFNWYAELFLDNVSGRDHPGIKVKTTKSGLNSIKFDWKYWRLKDEV